LVLAALQVNLTNNRFQQLNKSFCDQFAELEMCVNGVITGDYRSSQGIDARTSGLLFSPLIKQLDAHKAQISTTVSL